MTQTYERPATDEREDVLAAVDRILPILARNADKAEIDRALPQESYDALIESGALRLFVPRRFGGVESGYRTYVDTTVKVASACGASAWFCFILNAADWSVGWLGQEAQDSVWRDGPQNKVIVPLTPGPDFHAERVEGGMRLTGEWPYSSGSDRARSAVLGFPWSASPDSPPQMLMGLVSMSEAAEIKDTWHVSGMKGTASNTVVFHDVFVPDSSIIPLADILAGEFATPYTDETLYRMDVTTVFHNATLAVVVGLAKAALDRTLQRLTASPKAISYTFYPDSTKSPGTQAGLARASWLIDTALEQLQDTADAIDAQALIGPQFGSLERTRLGMRAAQGHRLCREAMDILLDLNGAGSFALVSPMQRIWRDMAIATRHGMSVPALREEAYGRALVGAVEQQMTPFI